MKTIVITLALLFFCPAIFAQQGVADKLQGTWLFEKMEFTGDLSVVPIEEQKRVNSMNSGMQVTFKKDNLYEIFQMDHGEKVPGPKGKFELLEKGKYLVFNNDKCRILVLNEKLLKLSIEGRPVLVLVKKN